MTDFEYRPQPGFVIVWGYRVFGRGMGEIDQEWTWDFHNLGELEYVIEHDEDLYAAETGASLTRVHGSHGWREFEWDDGAVHRYEWKHDLHDMRCRLCWRPEVARVYMVNDELWATSGLDGWPCFHCFEKAIGRRLVPADFKPGVPCNIEQVHPELRARMGLDLDTASD